MRLKLIYLVYFSKMLVCQMLMIFISISEASFEFEYLTKPVRKFYFVIGLNTPKGFHQNTNVGSPPIPAMDGLDQIYLNQNRFLVSFSFEYFNDSLFFVPKDLGMRKRSSWSTFFNKNKVKRQHGHFNDDLQMAEYL